MSDFCKACATSDLRQLHRQSLVENAGSVRAVHGILLDTLAGENAECLTVAHLQDCQRRDTNDDRTGSRVQEVKYQW